MTAVNGGEKGVKNFQKITFGKIKHKACGMKNDYTYEAFYGFLVVQKGNYSMSIKSTKKL